MNNAIDIKSIIKPLEDITISDGFGNETVWYAPDDTISSATRTYRMSEITKRQYWCDVCNGDDTDDDTADAVIGGECYADVLWRDSCDGEDLADTLEAHIRHNPSPEPHALRIMENVLAKLRTALDGASEID